MGLSSKHHSELNKVYGIPKSRYDELRREYANDPLALEEIDIYDSSTEYHDKIRTLVGLLKHGGSTVEIDRWFAVHYPLTSK